MSPDREGSAADPHIVCIGGGHGLAAALGAARQLTPYVTAIVSVADDGGSSGILRRQLGIAPPGDLRMALAALAGDVERSALLQYRFREGELAGHPLGNLLIAALTDIHGDLVWALQEVALLTGARGRVLPAATEPLVLHAQTLGGEISGQVAIATCGGGIEHVWVEPDAPGTPEAIGAIRGADLVMLGPGSLFTSVIAALAPRGIADAVAAAERAVFVMNLHEQTGETPGMGPADHLRALVSHVPGLRLAAVVGHSGAPAGPNPIRARAADLAPIPVIEADLATGGVHDPDKLASLLKTLL